jgi:hypothetical protein
MIIFDFQILNFDFRVCDAFPKKGQRRLSSTIQKSPLKNQKSFAEQ